MFSSPARVKILILGFFANVVYQTKSEIYVDGSRTLKRHSGHGVAFANFAAHKFSYLNITPLVSFSVTEFRECGKHCVDHSSCFSFNGAAFRTWRERLCANCCQAINTTNQAVLLPVRYIITSAEWWVKRIRSMHCISHKVRVGGKILKHLIFIPIRKFKLFFYICIKTITAFLFYLGSVYLHRYRTHQLIFLF